MQKQLLILSLAVLALTASPGASAQNWLNLLGSTVPVSPRNTRTISSTAENTLGAQYCCGLSGTLLRSYGHYCTPDEEDPEVHCPGDVTVDLVDEVSTAANAIDFVRWPEFEASDGQCGIKSKKCSHNPVTDTFLPGHTTVTCEATDGAGRTSRCAFRVIADQCTLYSTDRNLRNGAEYPMTYRRGTGDAFSTTAFGTSPPLSIKGCNAKGACSWAVEMRQSGTNRIHWLIYDIPMTQLSIGAGQPNGQVLWYKTLPGNVHQGQDGAAAPNLHAGFGANIANFYGYMAPYHAANAASGTSEQYEFNVFVFSACVRDHQIDFTNFGPNGGGVMSSQWNAYIAGNAANILVNGRTQSTANIKVRVTKA